MAPTDPDADIRLAALESIARKVERHGEILDWPCIAEGFSYRGEPMLFANRVRGIFRPKAMRAGALSIKTTVPRGGRRPRYDDLAVEGGFVYRFQGDDPDASDNNALQYAASLRAPMIYLYGVAPARYLVLAPVFIERVDLAGLSCEVVVGSLVDLRSPRPSDVLRAVSSAAKPRWEHAILRLRALEAWEERCAVCDLAAPALLDASVVWPQGVTRGAPEEDNALALCVLHRGVFERDLLGIDPTGTVHLAETLRHETRGGVVLAQGLWPFDRKRVAWPRRPEARPREDFLTARFARFLRAA
jgi:putative restriction endonuclease